MDGTRNVVLVVLDALRRDRVGTYRSDGAGEAVGGSFGDGESLTPNIDQLAADGTVFTHAFTCTNTTDPSITSIHTGRDPESVVRHHGPLVTDAEKRRAEAAPTVPEQLQEAGYLTAVEGRTLGRWHANGFEHYPQKSFDRYRRRAIGERLGAISPRLRGLAGDIYEWLSAATSGSDGPVDRFLDTLDHRPFYGMIHLMDTHVPYSYDEATVQRLLAENDYPNEELAAFFDRHASNPYVDETMREYAEPEDYEVGLARWYAKYDAAAVKADRQVRRLVDGLKRVDKLEQTTLIVISDHGESLDEHGILFEHHGLYEPQVRVPLVVSGPETPAARQSELVQLYDLAPTMLDLCGVERGFRVDGQSLAPLLGGEGTWTGREHVVFSEANAQRRLGIRTREYKYITAAEDAVLERERGDTFRCGYCETVHGERQELYTVREDPGETENLVEDRPEVTDRLTAELDAYHDSLCPVKTGDERVRYEDEEAVLDRLEDLGYR